MRQTFKCDPDFGPTSMNVSNGTSTCDGEQLCHNILKSIHNCRSYGLDKFGWTDTLMQAHTPNCHCDNYVLLTTSTNQRTEGPESCTDGETLIFWE